EGGAERDADAARAYERAAHRHQPLDALDAHRNDRHPEPRADHADAAAKRFELARRRALALGKNQDRPAVTRELADVLQRLTRTCLALRERERVEVERREIVVQRIGEPLVPLVTGGEEVGLEEFLGHRRRDLRTPLS